MNDDTRIAILAHAEREFPRESCGLIVNAKGHERYQPCKNLAQGTDHFIMDAWDQVQTEDRAEVLAVVHSHPLATTAPSQSDRVGCEQSGLPWYIVSWPNAQIERFDPYGYKAPLTGREFCYGVLDCYTLICDYYERELNIVLPPAPAQALLPDWWKTIPPLDLYMQGFAAAGFVRLGEMDELRLHDVILIQLQADMANHCAVYLGEQMILHHVWGRLSCREVFGGYWLKHARAYCRHKSLIEGGPDAGIQT